MALTRREMAQEEKRLDNRRILKNSAMLYLRTFLTMAVGLYTSRVVLEVLGVDDFGIYGLIGSLVILFNFFTNTLSSSLSRFFSFDIGSGDDAQLRKTFGASMTLVLGVALVILLITETAGIYVVNGLNIPEGSRTAAMWVYQFTVVTIIVNIVQVSFGASLVAHEHMGTFAYLDILNTTLKLAAIFILKYVSACKLELYGFLVMMVMILVTSVSVIYCRHHFQECRSRLVFRWRDVRPIMSFSGWMLYKTVCDTSRVTTVNVLINLYFGVALNAALAIAMNVGSNVLKFLSSVFLSFKPQIVKAYAMQAFANMQSLIVNALKFSLSVQLIICIPLIIEMPYILHLWLGDYPAYAVVFCRLIAVAMCVEVIMMILEFGINATGRIMAYSLLHGTLILSIGLIAWLTLALGAPPASVYLVQIGVGVVCVAVDIFLLKRLVPQLRIVPILKLFLRLTVIFLPVALGSYYAGEWLVPEGFWRFIVVGSVDVVLGVAVVYAFILPESARQAVRRKLHLG